MATTDLPTAAHLGPVEVARDTFVVHNTYRAEGSPVAVPMNALVIRGEQPVVVDTGAPIHRERYLHDLFGLVDPEDVRWVFISHDDADHYGNLHEVMAACPNATLVANWFLCERLSAERLDVPPWRWRWVSDGESLDVGDRTLLAVRPPLYDSPTTRGLHDPSTGVYWAADCFATPVSAPTAFADDLDPGAWAEGFTTFQAWNSPWVSMVDRAAFGAECRRLERLGLTAVASTHGPTVVGPTLLAEAFRLLRELPDVAVAAQPDQSALEAALAASPGLGALRSGAGGTDGERPGG